MKTTLDMVRAELDPNGLANITPWRDGTAHLVISQLEGHVVADRMAALRKPDL